MPFVKKSHLLFFVILIEGYVVLATELLAIRLIMPFVGSGIETTSIVIAGVLLPLALGYHQGGHARGPRGDKRRARETVRKTLLKNLMISLGVLTLGLSHLILDFFFTSLHDLGAGHRLFQATAYVLLFLIYPMFLLGQTVPLVSHYFPPQKLSRITGRMLFFSTVGSFLGSLVTTLVLMSYAGVHITVVITLALLFMLILLLSKRARARTVGRAAVLLALALLLNNGWIMRGIGVVSNNAYSMVQVEAYPASDAKIFFVNRSTSSILQKGKVSPYVEYVDRNFIDTMQSSGEGPRDILVLGAGGFLTGLNDTVNRYVFVDIDPALKQDAEEHFLPGPLTPNKAFVVTPARDFVHNTDKSFDLIFVDVFSSQYSVPLECTTQEFLKDVKRRLKPHGVVVVNMSASPDFSDMFTVRYDRTFSSVFPVHSRQVIQDFNPWVRVSAEDAIRNVLYIAYQNEWVGDATVYSDDRVTHSLDRR